MTEHEVLFHIFLCKLLVSGGNFLTKNQRSKHSFCIDFIWHGDIQRTTPNWRINLHILVIFLACHFNKFNNKLSLPVWQRLLFVSWRQRESSHKSRCTTRTEAWEGGVLQFSENTPSDHNITNQVTGSEDIQKWNKVKVLWKYRQADVCYQSIECRCGHWTRGNENDDT